MPQTVGADIEGANVEPPAQVITSALPVEPPQGRTADFQFTAEMLEKARREERDKLQRARERDKERQKALESELAELRSFRQEQEKAEQAKQRKAQREAKREEEKDLSAKEILARREAEWESRFTEQENRLVQMQAQARLENEAMKLQVYIQRRIAEEQGAGTIAPQFVDYIGYASTPEDVEREIELAKTKTAEILAEVASARQPQRQQGVSLSAGPGNIGSVTETTDDDDVDYRELSLADYIKMRPRLGIGRGGQGLLS